MMSAESEQRDRTARDLSQLMRLQERLFSRLQKVRAELSTPATEQILRDIRSRTGVAIDETWGKIAGAVEEALRGLKVFESDLKQELFDDPEDLSLEGMPDLPPHISRFLAERSKLEDFHYDVRQDPVRGWIIRWKEYTSDGTVRGFGQIYERPHAWLEE